MNHYNYTVEILINTYALGGSSDGIRIFDKNGKVVGYITDLRKAAHSAAEKKEKSKSYSREYYQQAKTNIGPMVNEVVNELKNVFAGTPAKVFINETMPNVNFMGAKFYFILSPLTDKIRVNIIHKDACRMKYVFPQHAKLDIRQGGKSILIDGLTRSEGIALVKGFCENVVNFEFAAQLAKK
ncbi:hypothetical protein [Aeromonas phage vB_AsM_ZHF]|uniref:Transcription terminator n=1 Tax=Aeromonas phage vB_AsM_ZHF TaxID=2812849 RepID=A0A898KAY7_9CAUD|nr:hypothetical protein [Aeromonas phage vB_AsM_ZHF]UIW12996.1 inhibitor of host transcription [Aeromonas phage AhMtk13a]